RCFLPPESLLVSPADGRTPATINRIYSVLHPDKPIFVLNLVHGSTIPAMGIFNFVVYMYISLQTHFAIPSDSGNSLQLGRNDNQAGDTPGPRMHNNPIPSPTDSALPSPGQTTLSGKYGRSAGTRDFSQISCSLAETSRSGWPYAGTSSETTTVKFSADIIQP